jgi:heat shock protein HspQ
MTEEFTFYIGEKFKAWITSRGGVVVDVDIVEYNITPAERHAIIQEYRRANERKPRRKVASPLYYRGELLEDVPHVDGL